MVKPKIKICGLTRICDIEAVNTLLPDYVGFVFTKSRRQVSPGNAKKLRNILAKSIIPVGVFVNESIDLITDIVKNGIISMIQLHGDEDEKYINDLKKLVCVPVIKSVAVHKKGDVQVFDTSSADYLLLDNKSGGTGCIFNWDLIGVSDKPYFLAGGLNYNNVLEAITRSTPFAVDVSSGVETNGFKDFIKIKDFTERVRNGE